MKSKERKEKMIWGLIYITTFIVIFVTSFIFKMKQDPFNGKYRVEWNDSIGKVYTDISYGDLESNKFDIYVPADNTKENYGLIVYLHAGGFTSGDKSGDAEILKSLCSKGYVTAGINYTLFNENNPTASVYSQSVEIKEAIPYVVAEAEKLGYQLDKMAIAGGSAGGTLALIYAYRDADTSPIPVTMLFEMVGPASFYYKDWMNYGLDKNIEAAASLFSVMSGNKITAKMIEDDTYLELVKPISADMWVKEGAVPALIAYGTHDKICPYLSVKPLIKAFDEYNVDYDYYEFFHSGHGLQNDHKIYQQYMEKLEEYLKIYMN